MNGQLLHFRVQALADITKHNRIIESLQSQRFRFFSEISYQKQDSTYQKQKQKQYSIYS